MKIKDPICCGGIAEDEGGLMTKYNKCMFKYKMKHYMLIF